MGCGRRGDETATLPRVTLGNMRTANDVLCGLTERDVKRFWTKVDRGEGTDSCWNWTGALHEKGYGTWTVVKPGGGTTSVRPHRVSWHLLVGPMADGLVVDHLCGNRRCVNPDHLEAVSIGTNSSRVPHVPQTPALPRLITALLATHAPESFAAWWQAWLASDQYARRNAEQVAFLAAHQGALNSHGTVA